MGDQPELCVQVRIPPLIGPGKMALLEGIDRHGSIAAAARSMGMAYPSAWNLLDSMNALFREPLVVRNVGGRRGGSAALTPTGRAVMDIFRAVDTKARIMFANDLDALTSLLVPRTSADQDVGDAASPPTSGKARKIQRNERSAVASRRGTPANR